MRQTRPGSSGDSHFHAQNGSSSFRSPAFSSSKRLKLVPELRIFTLDRELVPDPLPIFHFAAAHTYQNLGWVTPPPPPPPMSLVRIFSVYTVQRLSENQVVLPENGILKNYMGEEGGWGLGLHPHPPPPSPASYTLGTVRSLWERGCMGRGVVQILARFFFFRPQLSLNARPDEEGCSTQSSCYMYCKAFHFSRCIIIDSRFSRWESRKVIARGLHDLPTTNVCKLDSKYWNVICKVHVYVIARRWVFTYILKLLLLIRQHWYFFIYYFFI